ncbi:MAG: TetR family transcriptional regulator C-terminal domain-containing protein [Gemmatimonadota bacterium]
MPSAEQGRETRREILRKASELASTVGLEGLSIGRLADEVGMSKGGVYAHFGSKEDLQLATIDAAVDRFRSAVIEPAAAAAPGLERAWALVHGWIDSVEDTLFPGGCFFYHTVAEMDDRSGPARDRLAEVMRAWLGLLREQLEVAHRTGTLPDADPDELVFRIHAYVLKATWGARLLGKEADFERARAAVEETLARARAGGNEAIGDGGRDRGGPAASG